MTKTITSLGHETLVGRVRKRACGIKQCTNKTRMAVVVPVLDIEDDGGPGLAGVPVCSYHIEEAIIALSKINP